MILFSLRNLIQNDCGSESDLLKYQSSSDDDFINPNLSSTSKNTRTRIKLPTLGLVCDKYGISDRSAAAIASAVLKDVEIITTEDPSKIKCEESERNLEIPQGRCLRRIKSLYFDGRKVKTLLQEKKNDRLYKKTVVEEHISLIEEPESIGHVTQNFREK
ncbi:unnamed protein product [Psylliodes chrysocephalus]|uniref:Uncharacterized protein n=1 Tax=Psylliodes chrysocephalus TaxID=3402493 RepID=A0A9P0CFN1_9CUCU|nr:unnamed protein product [Psylliodes chrysocephala]